MGYWTRPADGAAGPVDWIACAIFMAVASLWSAAAAHWPALALPARIGGMRIDDAMLVGFGPAAGALAAALLRPGAGPRTGFVGRAGWWTVVALAAPVVTLGGWIAAVGSPKWLPPEGFVFAASVTVYCIGEEIGWRGWLRDALGGLPMWRAALTTAALWYAWHWTFLAGQLVQNGFGLVFAVATVLASFGLAAAVRRTGAIGNAVAWHAATKLFIAPVQIAAMIAVLAVATWAGGRARGGGGTEAQR